jgi:hypothetical protein
MLTVYGVFEKKEFVNTKKYFIFGQISKKFSRIIKEKWE